MNAEIYADDKLRQRWNDDTRTYTAWDEAGQQTASRAYTATENAQADAYAAAESQQANRVTIEKYISTAVTDNRAFVASTGVTAAQTVAQVKALTRQVNALFRLVTERFDGTD